MESRRSWFEELFPAWADRLAGIFGAGLAAIIPWISNLPSKYLVTIGMVGLFLLVWIAIKSFILVTELLNANRPPDVQVRTNLSLVLLRSLPNSSNEEDNGLASDCSLCIGVWNQGKGTNCSITLRIPAYLQVQITGAEGQSTVNEQSSDCYTRKFHLAKGEVHFLTINRFTLPSSMVQMYMETSKKLRIEVTDDSDTSTPRVQEITVKI